jgi:hypothetical protein
MSCRRQRGNDLSARFRITSRRTKDKYMPHHSARAQWNTANARLANKPFEHIFDDLPDGVPCKHPGCLSHVSHPCEGCGRIAGHTVTIADTFKEIIKDAIENHQDPVTAIQDYLSEKDSHATRAEADRIVRQYQEKVDNGN